MFKPCERRAFVLMAVVGLSALVFTEFADRTSPRYIIRCICSLATFLTLSVAFCTDFGSKPGFHISLLLTGLFSLLALISTLCPMSLTMSTVACSVLLLMFHKFYLEPLINVHNTAPQRKQWNCDTKLYKGYLIQWWYIVFIVVILGAYYNCQNRYPTYLGGFLLLWTVVGLSVIFLCSTIDEPLPTSRTFFVNDESMASHETRTCDTFPEPASAL